MVLSRERVVKSLNKKVAEIQQKLKAPKSQHNKFGNYYYRNCEDILEAAKPLLGDLTLKIDDEIVLVGDRYFVKATATVSDGENSISASAYARESESRKGMDDAQLTGATSSYARKYSLNGLFAIDDTKDQDAINDKSDKKEKAGDFKKSDKEEDKPVAEKKEKKTSFEAPAKSGLFG